MDPEPDTRMSGSGIDRTLIRGQKAQQVPRAGRIIRSTRHPASSPEAARGGSGHGGVRARMVPKLVAHGVNSRFVVGVQDRGRACPVVVPVWATRAVVG